MKNILSLTSFLALSVCIAFAQVSRTVQSINSLKKSIPSLHDSARIDCLNNISEAYEGLPGWFATGPTKAQNDSAEMLVKESFDAAQKMNYKYGMAKTLSIKAKIAFEKYDDYPLAEINCREALYYYRSSSNKEGLYKVYWRLGQALYAMSQFNDGINNLDTSFVLSKKAGDTLYTFSSIALSFNLLIDKGDYPKAFEKFQLFQQLVKPINNATWKWWETNMLGSLYENTGDYTTAINYYNQLSHNFETLSAIYVKNKQFDSAKKYFSLIVPDTSDNRSLRFHLAFVGEYYFFLNDYHKALPNLLRSLVYNKQHRDINQEMRLLIDISQTYFALNNNDSAFKYATDAFAVAKQTDAIQVLRDASKIIYSVYDLRHESDSAYFFYRQYHSINDSLANNKVQGKLAVYGYEQRIELLNQQQKVQELQLLKERQLKYFFISGIAVFLFIAFLLWRNNRHKQKANVLMQQQKEKVEHSLNELKSTQAQLIQSEKMASLGEMTAGIAHEIQNPLNFVNNFSDLNKELIVELKEELDAGNLEDVKAIANDIETNEGKISHHGKRAESIVTGMLQHSRTSAGVKESTDINKLADEYLRLAYNSVIAKNNRFHVEIKTDFDDTIGNINIIPQDIGRVLLNLYNNAFYAVTEQKKKLGEEYIPAVLVSTKKMGDKVQITVADNGPGIPQKIFDKIFQPFFTTKPTGQGTGLGLSLSYDIIKAHGAEIKVSSKEGEGSEFIINLIA